MVVEQQATNSKQQSASGDTLVVTPNLPEAEALTGMRIRSWDDMRDAAERIVAMGARSVVLKGGHFESDASTDLYYDGHGFREYPARRIDTRNTHGTGCTFASAIAAGLAKGESLPDAVVHAQAYVYGAIRHGLEIGQGHGPLDHFWAGAAQPA